VEISASGSLYGQDYAAGEKDKSVPVSVNSNGAISVRSNNKSEKIVAPGTKSDENGFAFSIKGEPEVSTKIVVKVTAQDIYLNAGEYAVVQEVKMDQAAIDDYAVKSASVTTTDAIYYSTDSGRSYTLLSKDNKPASAAKYYKLVDYVNVAKDYYPVEYKNESQNPKFASVTTAQGIALGVANSVTSGAITTTTTTGGAVTYEATRTVSPTTASAVSLSAINLESNKITWSWAFEDNENKENDAKDTILGQMMAASDTGSSITVVKIGNDKALTVLKYNTKDGIVATVDTSTTKNYEEKDVVASIRTKFDITITATQVD
jgi:hypothetical protein